MPQHGWICFNRIWICLNMFEFMILERFVNMYHTIHSARLFYKLMSSYWEMGVFRTLSKILDRALWKNNYSIFSYFCKTLHLKSFRGFWICAGLWICWILNIPVFSVCRFWISRVIIQFRWQLETTNSRFWLVNILLQKFDTLSEKEMKMIKTQMLWWKSTKKCQKST